MVGSGPGSPSLHDVRRFWESNPLAAAGIPHPLGTPEYFSYYDGLREANEGLGFSSALHEYGAFAGRRVLDVGCGNGYVLSKYAREGAEVYGVDLTRTAVELSARRFELLGLRGRFSVGNAEGLPFPERTFDCVCAMGVLHHTPSPAKAVDEIFRVLKAGGRLIMMMYHRNSALYRLTFPFLRLVTGKSIAQLVNEVDGTGNPKGEVYSKRELRGLLRQFRDFEMFAGLLRSWMLRPKVGACVPEGVLARLERHWGWHLFAKCVKP